MNGARTMTISNYSRNIKALREAKGLTQQQFADSIGVTVTTIGAWETRGKKPKQPSIVQTICDLYNVTEQDLFGFSDGYYAKAHGLTDFVEAVPADSYAPVLGDIAGGDPREAFELTGEMHYVDPDIKARYPDGVFFRVRGESMNRVLPDGCYAFLAKQEQHPARTGDVVAVKVNGDEATIKRIKFFEGVVILEPDSTDPQYKRIIIDESDPDAPYVRVIGKVVWYSYEGAL